LPLKSGLLEMVGELSLKTSALIGDVLSENGRFKIAMHGILDFIPVRRTTRVLFVMVAPLKKLRKLLAAPAAIFKIRTFP